MSTLLSAIRFLLARRCSLEDGLSYASAVPYDGKKDAEGGQAVINASVLAELQRRILKAEANLREKEEENGVLRHRVRQYENRWSEYEQKMKSMEEVWQRQMRSLQSSLSSAKQNLAGSDGELGSDSSAGCRRDECSGIESLDVIGRLAEEFERRSQVFTDNAKFLVEVKSGQARAGLDPDKELKNLKVSFEAWRKDYSIRLRETKAIVDKLSVDEQPGTPSKKRWWGRLNSSRFL